MNLGNSSKLKARIGWQGLTTAEYKDYGDYYLITGTDFKNGYIDWKNCVNVEKMRYRQDRNIQIEIDDILVTKDGTIGKVSLINYLPKPTTLNSGVFVIRPKSNNYYPRFLYYILMSLYFERFLDKLTAGSTISHLYQKDFVFFNFPLPPTLEEQKAIADALSDADELIEALDKLIEKKESIKTGAMQELLTGKRRLPGFSGKWEEKRLGDVAKITMGQSPSSSFYNLNEGLPLIQGNADIFNRKTIKRIYTTDITKKSFEGDIIMTVRAPVGEVAKATFNSCIGRGVCAISFHNNYLYYYLIYIESGWEKYSAGSTFTSINSKHVKELILNLPNDVNEQNAIAEVLSDMDKEIEKLKIKRNKAKQIKEGMMQELLTGKTRLV